MKDQDAYDFLKRLCNFDYPYPDDVTLGDFLVRPEVLMSLEAALDAMDQLIKFKRHQWTPMNAGKKWSNLEDWHLHDEFELGLSIHTLAALHQRTEESIRARLTLLDIS